MAAIDKFLPIHNAIQAGIDKLAKYYLKTDDLDVYFVCLGKFSAILYTALVTHFSSSVGSKHQGPLLQSAMVHRVVRAWYGDAREGGKSFFKHRICLQCLMLPSLTGIIRLLLPRTSTTPSTAVSDFVFSYIPSLIFVPS